MVEGPAPVRPFYRLLGMIVVEATNGRSTVRLASRAELENSRGDVHGGAIATLLDAALATACRSTLDGGGVTTSTISITYLDPGRGDLLGHGQVVRRGRTLIAATAEVHDGSGRLVAQAQGTLRVINRGESDRP
ncbi:PaaI family thioesterase [Thalassobaculum sp.]|uniref:PaaI family thioesterase n=1 Tax=Thalassobaculum sp. TaxID=2022740 RepID=UPI0032EF82D1